MLEIEINDDTDILISDSFSSINVTIGLIFIIFMYISFDQNYSNGLKPVCYIQFVKIVQWGFGWGVRI